MHELEDQIRGKRRRSVLILPDGLTGRAPMLIAMHDTDSSPEAFYGPGGWQAECAKRGWVGIFPHYPKPDLQDDNSFLAHLIVRMAALGGGDTTRVYVAGHGAGGRRAYAFGCANPGLITAVAAASAVIRFTEGEHQDPERSTLSVLHLHGGADTRVPLAGGPMIGADDKPRTMASVDAGLAPWIAHIDGKPATVESPVPAGATASRWTGGGREVLQVVVPDLDQSWRPGLAVPLFADFFARAPSR